MKSFFLSGKTQDIKWRKEQLRKLKKALIANEAILSEALNKDLGKSSYESFVTELGLVHEEINYTIKHLGHWARPQKVKGTLVAFPSKNYTLAQPLGLVLIMSPWNYPIQLTLAPLVAAIGAGDCIVVKPSRYSAFTSKAIKNILDSTFEKEFISTYEGGSEMNVSLLKQRFDYIFFTGSPAVGKTVMRAAAETLTPVSLELGGKSPVIVDDTADLRTAARRIAWGKCINAGQTCVAPDYLIIDAKLKDQFITFLREEFIVMYGDNPIENSDFPHIINDKHYTRLKQLLKEGHIVIGGRSDDSTRKIEPTVIVDPQMDKPLMNDEIFGPILPVITYTTFSDACKFVQMREHPLALYLFSNDKKRQQYVTHTLLYGGGCINDTVMHLSNPHMAFGGVGNSGMGSYHGKAGFESFSHRKSIIKKGNWIDIPLRYAPYKGKLPLAKKLMK